eukprot:12551798-Ditylum_brightwellii.AAC.1
MFQNSNIQRDTQGGWVSGGSDYLQLTTEIWRHIDNKKHEEEEAHMDTLIEEEENKGISMALWKKAKLIPTKLFPFLGMKMRWWENSMEFCRYRNKI